MSGGSRGGNILSGPALIGVIIIAVVLVLSLSLFVVCRKKENVENDSAA